MIECMTRHLKRSRIGSVTRKLSSARDESSSMCDTLVYESIRVHMIGISHNSEDIRAR